MPLNDVDHRLSPPPTDGYVYQTAWRVATGPVLPSLWPLLSTGSTGIAIGTVEPNLMEQDLA